MVRTLVGMLKAGGTVMKNGFPGQSTIGQSLEGSKDGHKAELCILLLDQCVEFLRAQMASRQQEALHHQLALTGHFESALLEVFRKNFQFLFDSRG